MEDLPDKVSKRDFGGMSEILEAIKKFESPKQVEEFYERYLVKIQKSAKKQGNGNIIENPEKYACGNIKFCLDNLEGSDKELIMERWFQAIPNLGDYSE